MLNDYFKKQQGMILLSVLIFMALVTALLLFGFDEILMAQLMNHMV